MSVNATEFETRCLKLIDEVAATRQPLVITKRGKPVARVVPVEDQAQPVVFGFMKGTGKIIGDIIDLPPDPWSAEIGDEGDPHASDVSQRGAR